MRNIKIIVMMLMSCFAVLSCVPPPKYSNPTEEKSLVGRFSEGHSYITQKDYYITCLSPREYMMSDVFFRGDKVLPASSTIRLVHLSRTFSPNAGWEQHLTFELLLDGNIEEVNVSGRVIGKEVANVNGYHFYYVADPKKIVRKRIL